MGENLCDLYQRLNYYIACKTIHTSISSKERFEKAPRYGKIFIHSSIGKAKGEAPFQGLPHVAFLGRERGAKENALLEQRSTKEHKIKPPP